MKKSIWIWLIVFILFVLGVIWLVRTPGKAGAYDQFAQCIAESGAKFYGTFWCPHCQDQKATFGSSAKLLPYVECSTPDGQGQLQVCADAGIQGYPTWVFPDGSRESGTQSVELLSEKTGCPLPGGAETSEPENQGGFSSSSPSEE